MTGLLAQRSPAPTLVPVPAGPAPTSLAGASTPPCRPESGSMIPEGYMLTTRFLREVAGDDGHASCVPSPHVHREHTVFWAGRAVASDLGVEGIQRSLAPGQGLFLPAGTPHTASRAGTTPLAVLFVHPQDWPEAPSRAASVVVNAALREMLIHLSQFAMPKEQRLRAQRVCLELITDAPHVSLALPVPRDPRIEVIARAILSDPADDRSLEDWAYLTSASTRTVVRCFRAETGMTFAEWRSCARMSAAVELLGDGVPVGVVARRVGYSTASAFSAAFHRMMGRPPHRFLPSCGVEG